VPAGDDAERSDEEERRRCPPATMQSGAMRRSGVDARRRRCRAER
jgi:hypothetical protein